VKARLNKLTGKSNQKTTEEIDMNKEEITQIVKDAVKAEIAEAMKGNEKTETTLKERIEALEEAQKKAKPDDKPEDDKDNKTEKGFDLTEQISGVKMELLDLYEQDPDEERDKKIGTLKQKLEFYQELSEKKSGKDKDDKPDDIEAMKAFLDGTLKRTRYERLQVVGHWAELFPSLDKPVIAAINGACVGAGLGLALSCDIRIASETAKFGSLFILRALAPDTAVTYFLPRLVGVSKALELMFTGELFDAAEAERLGIVSRVTSPDKLIEEAQELAVRIVQQPPIALELTKRLVYRSIVDDVARHLDWETYAQQLCKQTEDHKDSVLAFLEKRLQPQFKGK